MTAPDTASLKADVADLGALVADIAAEAARIAVVIEAFGVHADVVDLVVNTRRLSLREGYEEGRAERDPLAAEARARQRRAQFRLITGDGAPKGRQRSAKAAPRKQSGGAA